MSINVVSFEWNGDAIGEAVRGAVNAAVTTAAASFADTAARSLPVDRGFGVRSKPGDPPNNQTGNLRNSIGFTKATDQKAWFGTNVMYGRHLEFGTVRMAARPWIRPAAANGVGRAFGQFERMFKVTLKANLSTMVRGGGG